MTRALQTSSLVLLASSVSRFRLQHVPSRQGLQLNLMQTAIISCHPIQADHTINGQIYLLLVLPLLTDILSLPSRYFGNVSGYRVSAFNSTKIPSFLPLKVQVEIIPVLPFWVLVTLGAYLLGRLGLGVMRFKDCESAYTELTGHIEKAKKDLDARHVSWS